MCAGAQTMSKEIHVTHELVLPPSHSSHNV